MLRLHELAVERTASSGLILSNARYLERGEEMANGRNVFTPRACLWLMAVSVVAPVVYALVQSCWALGLMPVIKALGIRSASELRIVFFAYGCSGALVAAIVLACPLAILARQRSGLLGFTLGVIAIMTIWALQSFRAVSTFSTPVMLEYASFVLFCTIAAHLTGAKPGQATA